MARMKRAKESFFVPGNCPRSFVSSLAFVLFLGGEIIWRKDFFFAKSPKKGREKEAFGLFLLRVLPAFKKVNEVQQEIEFVAEGLSTVCPSVANETVYARVNIPLAASTQSSCKLEKNIFNGFLSLH